MVIFLPLHNKLRAANNKDEWVIVCELTAELKRVRGVCLWAPELSLWKLFCNSSNKFPVRVKLSSEEVAADEAMTSPVCTMSRLLFAINS